MMGFDNAMNYNGFFGSVEYSADDNILHGKVLGVRDTVTYEAADLRDLRQEFEYAVDEYLEDCKLLGREPNRIESGKFNVRIGADLHRILNLEKELTGESINTITIDSLWARYQSLPTIASEISFDLLANKVAVSRNQFENIFTGKRGTIHHFAVAMSAEKERVGAKV
ncbi:type II toxin-antitoxin system HicB family antitoxin [Sulfurimonas sp. HSL1-6]|uniref:type II toxin-antitoxin system HicB family antitoxin n=1 Tax=Thiomicrolovo immobilis TaxID=3131935 RepID=UPI0031F769A1